MTPILILGGGGHARVIIDLIRALDGYRIAGVLDDHHSAGDVAGVPVLGTIDDIQKHASGGCGGVVAIGDNAVRCGVVERLAGLADALTFVSLVHPSAVVAPDVRIGAGSVIMAGAVVQTGSVIGRHCVVNTAASLDHDNVLADFASVGPGAVTAGGVRLGEQSFLGIGSVVRQGVSIGARTFVGAGSLVLDDLPADVLCYGAPARVVRPRQPGERMR